MAKRSMGYFLVGILDQRNVTKSEAGIFELDESDSQPRK